MRFELEDQRRPADGATEFFRAEILKQNPAWAGDEIKAGTGRELWGILLFTLFWNAISAPVLFQFSAEIKDGNWAILIALLFPLIGLFFVVHLFREILRWRKYGASSLKMIPMPALLGGTLGGVIYTSVHVNPEDGFHLSLRCIKRITTGSGKNRHTEERILWQKEALAEKDLLANDMTRSAIPVLFELPGDQPPSSSSKVNSPVVWKLEVSAATPGIDYQVTFEVPVFPPA